MKVKFLIAEEVRPEAEGKLTVIGLYSGDTIILIKKDLPPDLPEKVEIIPAIERLAILATVGDTPKGVHKFKGRIVDPSGAEHKPVMNLGEAAIEKGTFHNVLVEIKPFVTKIEGVYHFEFFVDDDMFDFPFEIRERVSVS